MIFRQFFDCASSTYTYLLASRYGGEALIIDPVLERVDRYLQLGHELDLNLVKVIDTHLHADHVMGSAVLRDRTHCITVMGEQTHADVIVRGHLGLRISDSESKKPSNPVFLTSCCSDCYTGSRRARRSSGPARPYIVRLSAFRRLICPSVWPLLQGSVIAFLTASMSLCAVRAKRCIAYKPDFWASLSQAPSLPTLLLLRRPLKRIASRRIVANYGQSFFIDSTFAA